jgi:AraC-like DNA-binding protein
MDQPTVIARLASLAIESAVARGLSRSVLIRDMGLTEAQLADPDRRIPAAALPRFWRVVEARIDEPLFGLLSGSRVRLREFGLVGYTMTFSDSLRDGLERLARYEKIVSETLSVSLEDDPAGAWIRMDVQPEVQAFRLAADSRLAILVSACREMVGPSLAPLSVRFPYRKPADVREYERFFRCPLEHEAPATSFLLREEDLRRAVGQSDPILISYLDRLAQETLDSLRATEGLEDHVRRAIWPRLASGVPALAEVAKDLGMSARTLQRRLRGAGTSFVSLVDKFRSEMAPALLRDGRMAVSEVAFLLGYADPSSFQRAFRRWKGISPSAYRMAQA